MQKGRWVYSIDLRHLKNGYRMSQDSSSITGADVTIPAVDGVTALTLSLSHNNETLSELFLGHEAIRVYLQQNLRLTNQDEDGRTVLHRDVSVWSESLVRLLLDLGATDSEDKRRQASTA